MSQGETYSADYRKRIYDAYVNARDTPLAPATLAGLQPRMPYLRQLIRKHFPQNKNTAVLELGCGHGALLHALAQSGYTNIQGVDGSPEQISAAERLGIKGVQRGNLMEALAKFQSASLDVVVAFDVIEHFTKPELIHLVDEVRRVLKSSGRWIIHTSNVEGPFGGRSTWGDFTHELAFTRVALNQLLLSSGFARAGCFEDRPVVHGLKSAGRALLWSIIRVGLLSYIAIETGEFDRHAVFSQNLLAVAYKDAT